MSNQDEIEKFTFTAQWYDPHAALTREYFLYFYFKDNTIEMYDIKNKRLFLRRSKQENISIENMYVGSTINILSRQLKLTGYADGCTQKGLSTKKERTLGFIKPDTVSKMGSILDLIQKSGFLITKLKMCQLSRSDAMQFYQEHQSKDFFNKLIGYISQGPVIAFELMREGAIQAWRDLLGPTDSVVARSEATMSIRARFGKDSTFNACHGSDSPESAERELSFFFGSSALKNTAKYDNCTCCIIKPHAIMEGSAGQIIDKILDAGFEISSIQMFNMEKANAEEFYEVYKGVVQEYMSMVGELICGPCIAMEIRASNVKEFREMVGPADPEIARHLRPRTLRAKFGKDKIKNAVHCTDLEEDGLLEVEYFFKILDQ